MLNLIDEFTRECLAIRVDRQLRSTDVIDVLSDLFILRGVPDHIRSDNGPITGRSSSPKRCGSGSPPLARRLPTLSRQSLGERLLRELQCQVPRRTTRRRDLLQPCRSEDHHRQLASALQHEAPALILGLSAPGSRRRFVAGFATRSRFAGHPTVAPRPVMH